MASNQLHGRPHPPGAVRILARRSRGRRDPYAVVDPRRRHGRARARCPSPARAGPPIDRPPPSPDRRAARPVGVTGGEWRTYGHDLSNTRAPGPREGHRRRRRSCGLAKAWAHQSPGAYNNTPIVADGCMYLADVRRHRDRPQRRHRRGALGAQARHRAGRVRWRHRRLAGRRRPAPLRLRQRRGHAVPPGLATAPTAADAWHAVLDTQPLSMSNASPVRVQRHDLRRLLRPRRAAASSSGAAS